MTVDTTVQVQQPYADGVDPLQNPKDRIGVTKVSLWLVPSSGVIHEAMAFADGARKYGAYNWRLKKVLASIYLSAAQRHIYKWLDGEMLDGDSGVHHLGHARACLGILLDAEETGNLQDDRPTPAPTAALLSRLIKQG